MKINLFILTFILFSIKIQSQDIQGQDELQQCQSQIYENEKQINKIDSLFETDKYDILTGFGLAMLFTGVTGLTSYDLINNYHEMPKSRRTWDWIGLGCSVPMLIGYVGVVKERNGYRTDRRRLKRSNEELVAKIDFLKEKQLTEWELAKSTNTINSYHEYIIRYPNGIYVVEAIDELWEAVKEKNTYEAYCEYLKWIPKGYYTLDVKKAMWDYCSEINTIEAYNDYLIKSGDDWVFSDRANDSIMKLIMRDERDILLDSISKNPENFTKKLCYYIDKLGSLNTREAIPVLIDKFPVISGHEYTPISGVYYKEYGQNKLKLYIDDYPLSQENDFYRSFVGYLNGNYDKETATDIMKQWLKENRLTSLRREALNEANVRIYGNYYTYREDFKPGSFGFAPNIKITMYNGGRESSIGGDKQIIMNMISYQLDYNIFVGAYCLYKITGIDLGIDKKAWQSWWSKNNLINE